MASVGVWLSAMYLGGAIGAGIVTAVEGARNVTDAVGGAIIGVVVVAGALVCATFARE